MLNCLPHVQVHVRTVKICNVVVKIWGYHETATRSQGQDYKDFVGIFLCDMDYYPWFLIVLSIEDRVSSQDCQDLVLSSTVVTGKERLMKMPNIQYVCLSGSEVILTLSSYHFCWIHSSLNSFSLQKNCSTGYSIRKDVCVLTLLCSGWGCWAGLHSWRSITLWCI